MSGPFNISKFATTVAIGATLSLAASLGAAWPASAAGSAAKAWVSGHGADAAGCGPSATPCRTFQYVHDHIVAPGGVVAVLDPAAYGPVTISMAISIVNDGAGTAEIPVPAGYGVTINAGAGDDVHIRGLTIDGFGAGANGVVFNSGASLSVIGCVIRRFAQSAIPNSGNGILLRPETNLGVPITIADSLLTDNGNAGLTYSPPATSNAYGHLVISRVTAVTNNYGMILNQGGAGILRATISNSVASNSNNQGIIINASTSGILASIENSVINNNDSSAIGLFGQAQVYLGRNEVRFNGTGIANQTSPNGAYSYGDNRIDGNSNGPVSGSALLSRSGI